MRWLLVLVLLGGCGRDPNDTSGSVVGTRADMLTPLGDANGFSVTDKCDYASVGVIGRGKLYFDNTQPLDELRGRAIDRFATAIYDEVKALDGVWGVGYGVACTGGGASINTNNWRTIDAVIVKIGDYLRKSDLREQVGIWVSGSPVANSAFIVLPAR
jgi:hypothetical protein